MRSVTGDRIRKVFGKGSEYPKHFFILFDPHNILGWRNFSKTPLLLNRNQRLRKARESKWNTQNLSLTNEQTQSLGDTFWILCTKHCPAIQVIMDTDSLVEFRKGS